MRARGYAELPQHYPQPGWVEHDPEEIWATIVRGRAAGRWPTPAIDAGRDRRDRHHQPARDDDRLGARDAARPIHRAIVWQCRRTAAACDRAEGRRARAGSCASAPASCSTPTSRGRRSRWLLDHVPGARRARRARRARVRHRRRVAALEAHRRARARHRRHQRLAHAVPRPRTVDWDDEMLRAARRAARGAARASSTSVGRLRRDGRPRLAAGGRADRGHRGRPAGRAVRPGVLRAGQRQEHLRHRLLRAAQHGRARRRLRATACSPRSPGGSAGATTYALEGSVFIAGAAVQWLRDGLGIIAQRRGDARRWRESVPDTGGVYFVPAFVGLGAPYWDPYARGTIVGLTRGTDARPPGARGAGGDRLPEPRRARRDGRATPACRCARCASTAAPSPTTSSASSRPTSWTWPCMRPARDRDHRARRRLSGRPRRGPLALARRAGRAPAVERTFTPRMDPARARPRSTTAGVARSSAPAAGLRSTT